MLRRFFALKIYPTYCTYRRGPTTTRGDKGKHHWIVLPTKYQMGIEHPKWIY